MTEAEMMLLNNVRFMPCWPVPWEWVGMAFYLAFIVILGLILVSAQYALTTSRLLATQAPRGAVSGA